MSSLDMLCNLAYVKNVSTTDFFKVELDFQSGKMDLFDIRIRLGVSRGHSVRDKSTVLNVYIFRILKAVAVQFRPEVTIESRSATLESFDLSRKSGKMQSTIFFSHLKNCQFHS